MNNANYKTPYQPIRRRTIRSRVQPEMTSSDSDGSDSECYSPLATPLIWTRPLDPREEEGASSDTSSGRMHRPRYPGDSGPHRGDDSSSDTSSGKMHRQRYLEDSGPDGTSPPSSPDCQGYGAYEEVDKENPCWGCRIQHPSQLQHMGYEGACLGDWCDYRCSPSPSPRGLKRERTPSPCFRRKLYAPTDPADEADDESEELVYAAETPEKPALEVFSDCVPETPEKNIAIYGADTVEEWSSSMESQLVPVE